MADHDNRAFHTVAGVLALIAALLGHAVTVPHPQAWFFGAAAAFAVLLPAEVAYFVLSGKRMSAVREVRAPEPVAFDHHLNHLGRALAAIETVKPWETELSAALKRAVTVLERHKSENTAAVVELRVTVKQTTEKLERYARDENPDPVMLEPRLQLLQDNVEHATGAVEPR
ncbi:hypothetical protein [Amycolatopsis sp. NPDC051071]|uniref:hypothetical protein n=1 Tax=Amycolatopsis sp. NPDC051071 TaxID=3154637 RepID=UPI003431B6DE